MFVSASLGASLAHICCPVLFVIAVVQICSGCYSAEMTRVASGAKSRLPGTLALTDLTQQVRSPACV